MRASHDEVKEMLVELLRRNPTRPTEQNQANRQRQQNVDGNFAAHARTVVPRMEFPKFMLDNPRGWVRKCAKYFMLNPIYERCG